MDSVITEILESERMILNRKNLEDYDPLIQVGVYGLGKRIQEKLPFKSQRTAVLYGQTPGIYDDSILLSTYPQILYGEAMRGRRTRFLNNATIENLENVLYDDSFQNMILIGEGTSNSWLAGDGLVTREYLDTLDFNRKKGEIIKITGNNGIVVDEFALRIASKPNNIKYSSGKNIDTQILTFLRERVDYPLIVSH